MKKVVIYGVLNWGLGHATRSIPIIQSLFNLDYDVIICSDGDALSLLKKEFSQATFVSLPAYKIKYAHRSMVANISRYGLGLLKTIFQEKKFVKDLVQQYKPSFIISDNRYGFYHASVKSVMITHQLNIPASIAWQGKAVSKFLHKYIEEFDACWVPDVAQNPNLSGQLSHARTLSIPIHFLGFLSRFIFEKLPVKYDIAFVLSGPEPQRTRLEKMILAQLSVLPANCILVRGTQSPFENTMKVDQSKLKIIDLADSATLQSIMSQSKTLVSRAGYTTIMDLVALRRSAVLIPTPGQPEQEYLAEHLAQHFSSFTFTTQDDLDLQTIVAKVSPWSDDLHWENWSDQKLSLLLDNLGVQNNNLGDA